MVKFIIRQVQNKKEYKDQLIRVEKFPEDYKFVFDKMKYYMWGFAFGDGTLMLKCQGDLIELFENGIRDKKSVIELIGEDFVGFYDEFLLKDKKWTTKFEDNLNFKIYHYIN